MAADDQFKFPSFGALEPAQRPSVHREGSTKGPMINEVSNRVFIKRMNTTSELVVS